MVTATESVRASTVWFDRVRFVIATAIVWAALHYVATAYVLPRGLDRPAVLVGSPHGPAAGVLVLVVLWVGAVAATFIIGARDRRKPLMALGLALAAWAYEGGTQGGTIDSWLLLRNELPGPPTSGPYWMLLGDYGLLLLAVGGACAIVTWFGGRGRAPNNQPSTGTDAPHSARHIGRGLAGLLITTVVAGVIIPILTGSVTGITLRGQVYFAVALGFIGGTWVAVRLVKAHDPRWFWPAPLLLGIVGLLVAAIRPDFMLPPAYKHVNIIPAWGLVRALPVEMVGVGLLATLWMLGRTAEQTTPGEES